MPPSNKCGQILSQETFQEGPRSLYSLNPTLPDLNFSQKGLLALLTMLFRKYLTTFHCSEGGFQEGVVWFHCWLRLRKNGLFGPPGLVLWNIWNHNWHVQWSQLTCPMVIIDMSNGHNRHVQWLQSTCPIVAIDYLPIVHYLSIMTNMSIATIGHVNCDYWTCWLWFQVSSFTNDSISPSSWRSFENFSCKIEKFITLSCKQQHLPFNAGHLQYSNIFPNISNCQCYNASSQTIASSVQTCQMRQRLLYTAPIQQR